MSSTPVIVGLGCLLLFSQASTTSLDAGNQLAESLATTEWLGPLAPIALSPFFGLTILSGAACYGPEWLTERTGLLSSHGAFANPTLFWSMLVLSLLSSLPRLSKVSKPIALVSENLEAYASVIILLALKFLPTASTESLDDPLVAGLPMDVVMSIVVLLNIVIVNAVKLFFEFLIWLVPFPSIDAMLEALNKLLVVGLMGLYMFSPTLATILNLLILVACCVVFGRVKRLTRKYRTLIIGPVLARCFPRVFGQTGGKIDGFLTVECLGLPKHAHVQVTITPIESFSQATHGPASAGVSIRGRRWLQVVSVDLESTSLQAEDALIGKVLCINADGLELRLSHRSWVTTDTLGATAGPTEDVQMV